MKTLTALLIACLSVLGLSSCKWTDSQPVESKPSVQHVEPKGQPLDPPTVVTSPKVELSTQRVAVGTTPATVTASPEVTALVHNVNVNLAPLAVQVVPVVPSVPAPVCYEDMPCWNCQTMGNHICGTPAQPAQPIQAPQPAVQAPVVQAYVPTRLAPMPAVQAPPVPAQRVDPQCEESGYITIDWACYDPYSGNPIVDCEAQGKVTASDYTCVSPSYWDTDKPGKGKGKGKDKATKNAHGKKFDTGGNRVG